VVQRHDDPATYGGTPGDPGLIGPNSVSWEINADPAAVSQAGLPAIVLDILHPSVVAGVQDLSNYRRDPFARARATLGYVLTTTFGNTEAATRLIEHVKDVHSYVKGTRPDGVAVASCNTQASSLSRSAKPACPAAAATARWRADSWLR